MIWCLRSFRSTALGFLWAVGAWGVTAHAQQDCSGDSSSRSISLDQFHDNGDGTVTDRRSQKTWMRCAAGQQWDAKQRVCLGQSLSLNWAEARLHAEQVNQEGLFFFDNWRLPNIVELASIVERSCRNPRTNLTIFPGTAAAFFWSGTSARAPGNFEPDAFAMDFGPEGLRSMSTATPLHVRLVRTGL